MSSDKLTFGESAIRDRGNGETLMLNATDMWRAAGSPENKRPVDWRQSRRTAEKVSFLAENEEVGNSHVIIERGSAGSQGGGSTWLHWALALDYAEELSNEFWLWCKTAILERLQGLQAPLSGLSMVQETEACLRNVTHAVTGVTQAVLEIRAGMTILNDGLGDVRDDVTAVVDSVTLLSGRVGGLEQQLARVFDHKRKTPSSRVRAAHIETILARGGKCPSCEKVSLFAADGHTFIGEIDHHEKASNASIDATWPVCRPCNRTGSVRRDYQIKSYHEFRRSYIGPLFNSPS